MSFVPLSSSPSVDYRPSVGDIAFTPHYDTTYGETQGYNERSLLDKSNVWSSLYSHHAPSAQLIRQDGLSRSGYYDIGRTPSLNSEVQQLIQSRAAVLGANNQFQNVNSLRVSSVYGENNARTNEQQSSEDQHSTGGTGVTVGTVGVGEWSRRAYHDSWLERTLPAERAHQQNFNIEDKQKKWNSRTNNYESEYVGKFCEANQRNKFLTRDPDWSANTKQLFEEEKSADVSCLHEYENVCANRLPSSVRASNELICARSLRSMNEPVQRKHFQHLQSTPNLQHRNSPYPIELSEHISAFANMKQQRKQIPFDTFVCK